MLDLLGSPTTQFAQEAERRRIARELHDGVVQSLTALVADLEYFRTRCLPATDHPGHEIAGKVEAWQELARDSLTSIRQALGELRKPSELDLGLEYAIELLLSEWREAGYHVVYECDDWPVVLPLEYTSNIYYMIREALINIGKHAKATSTTVRMFSFKGHLHISIGDDGVGMPEHMVMVNTDSGYHQGLIGLRERATALDGQLAIESAPTKGTRIDIDIPLLSIGV